MERVNERKNGIILSYILLLLDTIINIVYTPILLKSLGESEYGLYQLIGSLVNYFAVMDLGLGGTITRYLIKYNSEEDEDGKQNFFAMALIGYTVLCGILLLSSIIVYFNIGNIFKSLTMEETKKAQILFFFLIVNLAITLYDHAFSGALQAYEKFTLDKSLRIFRVVVRAVLVIALLQFYQNSVVIVIVDFVLTLSILIAKVNVTRFKLHLKAKLGKWDSSLFREIFGFTAAIFLQSVINQFNNNVDKTVLGIYTTTATVAVYAVAMQIFSAYEGISTAVQSVFFPKISRGVFEGKNNDEVTLSLVEPSRIQYILLMAVCAGFWLYGYEFIDLWCGKTDAWIIACIVMTSSIVQLFQNTTTCVLKAKNILHGRTIINLFTAAGNFVITMVLVPKFGMVGAAAGTAFSMVVGYIILNNLYYKIRVGINIRMYFSETLKGLFPASLIGVAIGALPRLLIHGESWLLLIVKLAFFAVSYLTATYFIGLNKKEKISVKKALLRKSS